MKPIKECELREKCDSLRYKVVRIIQENGQRFAIVDIGIDFRIKVELED